MYDDYAPESYLDFCKLREKGLISSGTRFQVCLPAPFNVMMQWILPAYRKGAEVIYEAAMLSVLRRI